MMKLWNMLLALYVDGLELHPTDCGAAARKLAECGRFFCADGVSCALRPVLQADQRNMNEQNLNGFSGLNLGRKVMRKWCVTLAMGALIALPLCAQQKDAGTAKKSSEATSGAVASKTAEGEFNIAPASSNLFAMPAAPAAKPDIFSDWDNNYWNRHAWGRLT